MAASDAQSKPKDPAEIGKPVFPTAGTIAPKPDD